MIREPAIFFKMCNIVTSHSRAKHSLFGTGQ